MDHFEDVTRLPEEFGGRVRLFPLPGLVVFPHAMQPLHIFEPRYCEMLADCLASDQLIAMSTIDPSQLSPAPTANPDLHSSVCIGRVVSHTELEDEKHNLLLVGIRRAVIRQELSTSHAYRMAEVEIQDDVYPPGGAGQRRLLKGKLLEAFGKTVPPSQSVQKNLYELMSGPMTLGPITDIISFMLPFSPPQKLTLLSQPDVDQRASEIVRYLNEGEYRLETLGSAKAKAANEPTFPPKFSLN